MPENWESESVIEQFNRLVAIIEKFSAREEGRNNMDGVMFWEGYSACIHDVRYNGLILVADKLERSYNNHYG